MEDVKNQPIETSAVVDPTGESANILITPADQQPSFQESAIRPRSSDPSRQLHQLPRRQFQFGPPLCDGYAPESATPAQVPRQRREWQPLASSRELRPSSHSPGDKKNLEGQCTFKARNRAGIGRRQSGLATVPFDPRPQCRVFLS